MGYKAIGLRNMIRSARRDKRIEGDPDEYIKREMAYLLTEGIKALVERPRPGEYSVLDEAGYSFPSGHMLIGLSLYLGGSYLLTLLPGWREHRRPILSAGLSFSLLLGLTRLYLGVHHPSDVLAGAAMGTCWMASVAMLSRRFSRHLNLAPCTWPPQSPQWPPPR